jgi:hypothetical protein
MPKYGFNLPSGSLQAIGANVNCTLQEERQVGSPFMEVPHPSCTSANTPFESRRGLTSLQSQYVILHKKFTVQKQRGVYEGVSTLYIAPPRLFNIDFEKQPLNRVSNPFQIPVLSISRSHRRLPSVRPSENVGCVLGGAWVTGI